MTPPKPAKIPVIINLLLKLVVKFLLSNKTNHKGAADTNTATKELGSVVSAHIIEPFPMKSKRFPIIKSFFNWLRFISLYPFILHHTNNKMPEAKNRKKPRMKGGKPLSAACTKK